MNLNIVNAILFQLGWFACVLGGNLNAVVWIIPYLALHFSCFSRFKGEWMFVLGFAALGITLDSLAMNAGIFAIPGSLPFPIWLACLWIMMGTFIPHGLSWLIGRPLTATVCGAVGGCLSYYAGIRLGIARTDNLPLALGFWAVQWGLLVPMALAAAQRWLIEPERPELQRSAT